MEIMLKKNLNFDSIFIWYNCCDISTEYLPSDLLCLREWFLIRFEMLLYFFGIQRNINFTHLFQRRLGIIIVIIIFIIIITIIILIRIIIVVIILL